MPTHRPRKILVFPLLIAAAIIAFQFFSAEKFTNPETGRTARVGMSMDQEAALGLQSYKQILDESKIISSGPQYEQVVRVAEQIVSALPETDDSFEWAVSLIESPQANAFCLPGGKIAVYTGILPITQTDAGLAAVMAHEIAHATARHGAQRVFQQQAVQTALMGVQGSLAELDYQQQRMLLGLFGAGAQYGVLLPFGRDHETEADSMGLIYMARAGYDPNEAVAFWQRMEEHSEGQPPEWMSTHPSHGTRIERLRQLMPQAMEEYQKRQ